MGHQDHRHEPDHDRAGAAPAGGILIAALSVLAACFLGSSGSLLFGAGICLTIAYGYAVAAGAVRRYELDLGPAAPPHDAGAAGGASRRFA